VGQLPGPGAVFLDHVAHFVPDIEAAAASLARCGFRLTPFAPQTNRVNGAEVPVGTGNRCARLRQGYVELLAATAETPLAQQLRERLSRHVGLHLAAFSSADAAAEHHRLAAAGFPVVPLVAMHRPVATSAGIVEEARFTIARIAPGPMPEGRTQFLTHHTPDLVWRAGDLDHPNGAQALLGLWIAAADRDEAAARFARFTGRPARHRGEVGRIALERGALNVATPEFLDAEFGIAPGPPLPHFAASEITVESLARLRALFDAAGLPYRVIENGVALPLPAAVGGTIIFR
jgi:hypothetical protein